MSPVVGKALEATLVVLYIGLLTTLLYGGAVPEYRATAGAELADRTVSTAATDVERAVPPETMGAEVRVDVDMPPTIAETNYRIRADGDRLLLEHPDPDIEASVPLAVPDRVETLSGTLHSGGESTIVATASDGSVEVRLE